MTRFIEEHRHCGVELTCEVLGVGVSTHYDRLNAVPSLRQLRDEQLVEQIAEARSGFKKVYGVRKTWKQLKRMGVDDVGRDRVGRVMRQQGWKGTRRGNKKRAASSRGERLDLGSRAVRHRRRRGSPRS